MALDYKALARAQYDPLTENSMYRREKARLRRASADAYAAQFARAGSLAEQNDPNRAGSLMSEQYPGLFGRYSQQAQANLAPAPLLPQDLVGVPQPTLRRQPEDKTPFNLDDLDDDEFLNNLGLGVGGGLRRVSNG